MKAYCEIIAEGFNSKKELKAFNQRLEYKTTVLHVPNGNYIVFAF